MLSEGNKSGDSSLRDWFSKSKSSDGTPGWVQLGGKYAGKPCAKQPGQTTKPKCGSSKMKRNLNKDEEEAAFRRKNRQDPNPDRKGKAKNVATEETINEKEGKKDACYHKVKSRYSVWPSAYASGALVKCRKKGAKNWGNSTKKEEFSPAQISALEANGFVELDEAGKKCWKGYKKAGTQKLFGKTYNRCVKEGSFTIDPKAHNKEKRAAKIGNLARNTSNPGEKAAAEKKAKGPKLYGENITIEDANGNTFAEVIDIIKAEPLVSNVKEAVRIPSKTGSIITTTLSWRGKIFMIKMFFPQTSKPNRSEVQDQIQKVYPGSRLNSYFISDFKPGEQLLYVSEGAAWTKKAGKSESGGLNEKGRKSYERENPGSDLKAPSKKVGNPRRKSFCARMKGMKAKLTSKKTASDPDSRINKSLRAWNC